mmetsp:Transcript_15322/g.31152  ORF Transcript_15322/g.31152 Transcript_15322/m.31152 type:complete len:385 (-) Transcript_15322:507-1661(-)
MLPGHLGEALQLLAHAGAEAVGLRGRRVELRQQRVHALESGSQLRDVLLWLLLRNRQVQLADLNIALQHDTLGHCGVRLSTRGWQRRRTGNGQVAGRRVLCSTRRGDVSGHQPHGPSSAARRAPRPQAQQDQASLCGPVCGDRGGEDSVHADDGAGAGREEAEELLQRGAGQGACVSARAEHQLLRLLLELGRIEAVRAGVPVSLRHLLLRVVGRTVHCDQVEGVALLGNLHLEGGGEEVVVEAVDHDFPQLFVARDAEVVGPAVLGDLLGQLRVELHADADEGHVDAVLCLGLDHRVHAVGAQVMHVRQEQQAAVPLLGGRACAPADAHSCLHASLQGGAAASHQTVDAGLERVAVKVSRGLQGLDDGSRRVERRQAEAVILP